MPRYQMDRRMEARAPAAGHRRPQAAACHRPAVPAGCPGHEMMQGLRHGPERAVAGDPQALTAIMRP
jgi:hypothetical protein